MSRHASSILRSARALLTDPTKVEQLASAVSRSCVQIRPFAQATAAGKTPEQAAKPHWPPAPVHWIEHAVPHAALPYVHLARLHKPIGTWLFAWPCLWSIAMATPPGHLPDLYTIGLFAAGTTVRTILFQSAHMHAALCLLCIFANPRTTCDPHAM